MKTMEMSLRIGFQLLFMTILSKWTEGSSNGLQTFVDFLREHEEYLQAEGFRDDLYVPLVMAPANSAALNLSPDLVRQIFDDPLLSVRWAERDSEFLAQYLFNVTHEAQEDSYDDLYDDDYGDEQPAFKKVVRHDAVTAFIKDLPATVAVRYLDALAKQPKDVIEKKLEDSNFLRTDTLNETYIAIVLREIRVDTILAIAESSGLRRLFTRNLQLENNANVEKLQTAIATTIIDRFDGEFLAGLPDYLFQSQVNNTGIVKSLLSSPDKLITIFEQHPNLPSKISAPVVKQLASSDPGLFSSLPVRLISYFIDNPDVIRALPPSVIKTYISTSKKLDPELFTENNGTTLLDKLLAISSVRDVIIEEIINLPNALELVDDTPDLLAIMKPSHFVYPHLKQANLFVRIFSKASCKTIGNFLRHHRRFIVQDVDNETIRSIFSSRPKLLLCLDVSELRYMLQHREDAFLNLDPEVFTVVAEMQPEELRARLREVPVAFLSKIASKPGFLESLDEHTLMILSDNVAALRRTDGLVLSRLTNRRPDLVASLPVRALNAMALRTDVVDRLRPETINKMLQSKRLARNLRLLPRRTLLKFTVRHFRILTHLPAAFPAQKLIRDLMWDKSFLSGIPIEIHLRLADTPFRRFIDAEAVINIASLYPDLPLRLSPRALKFNEKYMQDVDFVNRLPCSVIVKSTESTDFVNRLNAKTMKAFARSRNYWSCLPVELIRKVLRESNIGEKLSAEDVVTAAGLMARVHGIDMQVVINMFRYQMPSMMFT